MFLSPLYQIECGYLFLNVLILVTAQKYWKGNCTAYYSLIITVGSLCPTKLEQLHVAFK